MKKIYGNCFLNSGVSELYSREFLERVTDYEKVFTDLFLDKIENTIGENGWIVEFIQYTIHATPVVLFADLYIDDVKLFAPITGILEYGIINNLKHIEIKYFHRGDVAFFRSRFRQ